MRMQLTYRLVAVALAMALAAPAGAQTDQAATWRTFAANLRPGARVDVALADGTQVHGTVIATSDESLVVNPKTRIPVDPWTIGLSEIRSIEVRNKHDGLSPGAKVLIGVGAGTAAFFTVMVILLAAWSD